MSERWWGRFLSLSRSLAFFSGALAALLLPGGDDAPAAPGRAVLLLADRAADRLVAVDEDDLPISVVPVPSPRLVRAHPTGGAWVVTAGTRTTRQLCRVSAEGEIEVRVDVGRMHGLGVLDGGEAVVLEGTTAGARVVRFDEDGASTVLQRFPGARCLATDGREVLVGRHAGVLLLGTDPDPGVSAWGLLGRRIDQVARGPWHGWWWALEAGGEGVLHLLDPRLDPRWSRSCGVENARMAPVPGHESVWVADGTQGRAVRLGPGGMFLAEAVDLPLRGIGCGSGRADGGVVWGVGGALLHLDAEGALVRTQGGFGLVSAVVPALP